MTATQGQDDFLTRTISACLGQSLYTGKCRNLIATYMLEPMHIVQRKTKKILTGSTYTVGDAVGALLGASVGLALGAVVGLTLGAFVGLAVWAIVVEATALLVNPLTQVTPRATKVKITLW